ncbi:MAG: endo-1,4-beta-xylanase [Leptolyngbyaceae cyanobacterium]
MLLLWGADVGSTSPPFVGNILRHNGPIDTTFTTYWHQVTPENSGKWGKVEAVRDVMDWAQLDDITAFAWSQGFPFKQHTFIWGLQFPDWITDLSEAEQLAEVMEWIAGYCTRYPNTDLIDVVNEPLHWPPPFKEAIGGNGVTGWDWVIWAFQTAREACPHAELLLNEKELLKNDGTTASFLTLVRLLQRQNLIDGIGVQGHFLESAELATIERNLDRLAITGLPIYISELDVDFVDDNAQRDRFAELFPILWEHPSVRGITLWGYKEGEIWRSNAYLLRRDGSQRPALIWLMDYLANQPG